MMRRLGTCHSKEQGSTPVAHPAFRSTPSAQCRTSQPCLLSCTLIGSALRPPARRKRYHASHLQHETFDPATAKVADFKEFGAGHLLYFFWLRYMAVVFLVLALVPAVPLMVFYLGGQFLTSSSTDLEASTIGNFGLPSSDADTASLPIVLTAANRGERYHTMSLFRDTQYINNSALYSRLAASLRKQTAARLHRRAMTCVSMYPLMCVCVGVSQVLMLSSP